MLHTHLLWGHNAAVRVLAEGCLVGLTLPAEAGAGAAIIDDTRSSRPGAEAQGQSGARDLRHLFPARLNLHRKEPNLGRLLS